MTNTYEKSIISLAAREYQKTMVKVPSPVFINLLLDPRHEDEYPATFITTKIYWNIRDAAEESINCIIPYNYIATVYIPGGDKAPFIIDLTKYGGELWNQKEEQARCIGVLERSLPNEVFAESSDN